jgi:hypothetical protein
LHTTIPIQGIKIDWIRQDEELLCLFAGYLDDLARIIDQYLKKKHCGNRSINSVNIVNREVRLGNIVRFLIEFHPTPPL